MYWTSKMQKNRARGRFIIAVKICSAKQSSKSVFNHFKLMYSNIKNFHKNVKCLSNFNKFWVLQISDPIIQLLNNINKKGVPSLIQHITFRHYAQSYLMIN